MLVGGFVGYAGVQHNDRPWLEFDSARALGSGRQMRAEGFRQFMQELSRAHAQQERAAQ